MSATSQSTNRGTIDDKPNESSSQERVVWSADVSFPTSKSSGYEVIRLVGDVLRMRASAAGIPQAARSNARGLDGALAVVNLSGVSIAGKRWSESRKREILESRLDATGLLARTIAESSMKSPRCSSRLRQLDITVTAGKRILTEQSPKGNGFLADVCEEWEAPPISGG